MLITVSRDNLYPMYESDRAGAVAAIDSDQSRLTRGTRATELELLLLSTLTKDLPYLAGNLGTRVTELQWLPPPTLD
uniref:Uncharacterized protein n=1 Tax=Amphimedon queenslandica TaxID=400682 RepID=A0A1X7V7U0_AMPQE